MKIIRFAENPLISPETADEIGKNINGPSIISKPKWLTNLPDKYLMYFAHHQGENIRLATADALTGPWTLYSGGTLQLSETICTMHVASPDIHIDEKRQCIIMYYHGVLDEPIGQWSFRAESVDGINFKSDSIILSKSYLRVFQYNNAFYALEKDNRFPRGAFILRSPDGIKPFVRGNKILDNMRHAAIRLRTDNVLDIFYSRGKDCPESILYSSMRLNDDWDSWKPTEPIKVLEPEMDYEGVNEKLEPSSFGRANHPVRQVRDPALFEENGKLYLFYSNAGEWGISGAEIINHSI